MAARLHDLHKTIRRRQSPLRERGVAATLRLPPATTRVASPVDGGEGRMIVELSRTPDAARRSGITQGQAKRFLQELKARSVG